VRPRAIALLDYVFLMRPIILVPGWVFLLLGYTSGRTWAGTPAVPWYPSAELVASLAVVTATIGGVYVLNQICDRETDRLNRKLYLISESEVSLRAATVELVLLNTAALVLAVLAFPPRYTALVVLSVVLGVLYSVRPVRLKGRAGWDIVANGVGFGVVAFALGWATGAPLHPALFGRALPYVLAVGAIHTNVTVLDLEGDRAGGDRTIAVALGVRRTLVLGLALTGGALLAALVVHETLAAIWAIGSILVFAWATLPGREGHTAAANRLSGRAFVVLEGLRFPYFLVWLAVVYYATKWYYRTRFGIDYPSLEDERGQRRPAPASASTSGGGVDAARVRE